VVLAAPEAPGLLLHEQGVVTDVIPTVGLAGRPPGLGWTGHRALNLHGRGPASHRFLLAGRPDGLTAFARADLHVPGPPWLENEHEVHRLAGLGLPVLLTGSAPEHVLTAAVRDAVPYPARAQVRDVAGRTDLPTLA